jgi:8-oxo-dGTP pyrophosphatase MutT (NUDIX family)
MDDYREDADVRNDNYQARGIILKDDQVLVMFRRKNGEEYYTFPGGHMRDYEDPLETAIREIEEETTIKVKNLKPALDLINYVEPEEREYYFVGEWDSGEPTLSGEESRRICEENYYKPMWIKVSDIPNLTLYSLSVKEWVMKYLDRFLKS